MTSRKEFLIAGTLAAATLPAVAQAAPPAAAVPPAKPDWPEFAFDSKAFDAALNGPQTHKHLFSSVMIEEGLALGMVANTLSGYKTTGVAATDVLPAIVFYHNIGIAIGFDDHAWDTYFIPVIPKLEAMSEDHAKEAAKQLRAVVKTGAKGNPFLHEAGSDDPKASIEALSRDAGLRIFMCNAATRGFSTVIAKQLGLKPLDVYKDLSAHIVPSAMLTPTGVWAVHAVQQHGFTLLPVTV